MSYSLLLHPLALHEMEESYQWYEQCLIGLGDRFLAAIQKKLDSITTMPELFVKKKGHYREILVAEFPFVII